MTSLKHLIYTILGFIILCLVSYAVSAQQALSMNDAVSLALLHNREIKAARFDVNNAQQQTRISKSMSLPTVSAGLQVNHYFNSPVFFGLGSTGNESKIPYGRFGGNDLGSAAVNLVQPVYNEGIKPARIQSELQERQGGLILTAKEVELSSIIKQTYLQVLVLRERIKLQNESLLRNKKALRDARSLLAQGRALRVDTLRAYTSVKNLEPGLLKLAYAVEIGKQQLKTLVGIDSIQNIELTDSLSLPDVPPVPATDDVYEVAKSQRTDLQSLSLQAEIDETQIKTVTAYTKPTVDLVAQYLVQTQTSNFNYFNAFYPSTPFVGLQVNIPVFNGNRNAAKIQQAKITRQQSLLQKDNAYELLKTEVKQVVANLHESVARIHTSIMVKETAQLSYDITQYRYAKGVASRLELTDAELSLTTAQSNYLEAVYDYLSTRIALEKTEGK
ncbi:MAG: TolC family protein [Chitinophagaceae bacterium]